ncbi:MAG TPA: DUF2177 family protein [Acholeplasmataceae bacterium]|nr:DUF2177 family protein [Acholeplasmataceae bacterium]
MKKLIILYVITILTFVLIDALWIGLVARPLYDQYMGQLLVTNIRWLPAIIFYLMFVFGLVVFVLKPAIEDKNYPLTLKRALLYGLVTYGTYDLTSYITIDGFSLMIVVTDILWVLLSLVSSSLRSILLSIHFLLNWQLNG